MKVLPVRPVDAPRLMPRIEVSLDRGPARRRHGKPRAATITTLAGLLMVGVAALVYQAELTPMAAISTVVVMAIPPARDAGSQAAAGEPPATRQAAPAPPAERAARTSATVPAVRTDSAPAANAISIPALDSRGVAAAVSAWAQAWSQRDMAAYFAAYGPDFKGTAKSSAAWQAERKDRITNKARIAVTVSDLKIQVHGQRAEVNLTQSYESGALRTVGPKRLTFELVGGRWLIQQELSGQ